MGDKLMTKERMQEIREHIDMWYSFGQDRIGMDDLRIMEEMLAEIKRLTAENTELKAMVAVLQDDDT